MQPDPVAKTAGGGVITPRFGKKSAHRAGFL
jgi:hypothetical protein